MICQLVAEGNEECGSNANSKSTIQGNNLDGDGDIHVQIPPINIYNILSSI